MPTLTSTIIFIKFSKPLSRVIITEWPIRQKVSINRIGIKKTSTFNFICTDKNFSEVK